MCGIALILSGIEILGIGRSRDDDFQPNLEHTDEQTEFSINNLRAALLRRGPESIGSRTISLDQNGRAEMELFGATLQLRGASPIVQPIADAYGNFLVYNGEIFGGVHVPADTNDAETLLRELENCCSDNVDRNGDSCTKMEGRTVPEILSAIRGPWALVYWQEKTQTVWFGRDAFGRRSLLVHWPTNKDSCFILSSVSPPSMAKGYGSTSPNNDFKADMESIPMDMQDFVCYWEELPCGVYSIHLRPSQPSEVTVKKNLVGEVRMHDWSNPQLKELIKWVRTARHSRAETLFGDPNHEVDRCTFSSFPTDKNPEIGNTLDHMVKTKRTWRLADIDTLYGHPAEKVLCSLRESVMRRTVMNRCKQNAINQNGNEEEAPIAVLFSGGLDSMILAALLDQCLESQYVIDLLNVSFDEGLAPDRISAREGVKELQNIAPSRRWRLVEIDACLSDLTWEIEHIMSLIHPARTYMDLNIGLALWLAARGNGWIYNGSCEENCHRYKYKSTARVLLVGSGADEQCAGYGRHRTKFRIGGWVALEEEMKLDMQRIWKRNLGRDDRCISDNGKEARFPFLDEDVIKTLLEIPLQEIANLGEPVGKGDKKILREVARLLGLKNASIIPKRAIQFGSRIARESNKVNFGSNRAANQASAGGVMIRQNTGR